MASFVQFCKISLLSLAILSFIASPTSAEEVEIPAPLTVNTQVLKASLSKTDSVSLNLEEALKIAEEKNPALQAASEDVNLARAQYQTRLAQFLPDVELSFSRMHYDGAFQIFGDEPIFIDRLTLQPQFLFRFNVFDGGEKFFRARAAKRTIEAQQAGEETTHQQVLRDTARLYYELKRQMDLIGISRQQLEETQTQLKLNQDRMEVGVGTRLEVMQSEAQVARSRQQLLEAVKNAEVAAVRLNEILDLPAFVDAVPQEQGQQMQTLVPANATLGDLLKQAYQHRPELQAFSKQIAALQELRKVAVSALLPKVDVQYRMGAVGAALSDLEGYDENALALGFRFNNLAVPVKTLYRENTVQQAQLKTQLRAIENRIERELSEAFLQSITKKAQVVVAKAEIAASEQALADALERLQVGVGRNIDVLEAETSLTRARTNLSSTILEYNQAQVDMVYTMGMASVQTLTQGIQLP